MSSGTPPKLLNEVESHLPEELKSGQVLKEKKMYLVQASYR